MSLIIVFFSSLQNLFFFSEKNNGAQQAQPSILFYLKGENMTIRLAGLLLIIGLSMNCISISMSHGATCTDFIIKSHLTPEKVVVIIVIRNVRCYNSIIAI